MKSCQRHATFRAFRGALALLACCIALGVSAAPRTPSAAPVEPSIGQGLLDRLSQAHQNLSDQAADLVTSALQLLGVPYRLGGNDAETGFDCSGFVRTLVEQSIGRLLPHSAAQQAAATEKIRPDELQPGDLVFFNTMRRAFSHVGIYLGDGKFIHSPRAGGSVRVEDMHEAYWARRFNGARRVLDHALPAPR